MDSTCEKLPREMWQLKFGTLVGKGGSAQCGNVIVVVSLRLCNFPSLKFLFVISCIMFHFNTFTKCFWILKKQMNEYQYSSTGFVNSRKLFQLNNIVFCIYIIVIFQKRVLNSNINHIYKMKAKVLFLFDIIFCKTN